MPDTINYNRLFQHSFSLRKKILSSKTETCCRLFHGDGEGAPGLTVDYYAGTILVQYFSHGFYPDIRSIAETVVRQLRDTAPVKSIWVKNRTPVTDTTTITEKRASEPIFGDTNASLIQVTHNGIQLYADIVTAQNTGVFMDMREVRDRLVGYYPEIHSILNLFSYTAAFSVHALKNGAAHAVNVDISSPVLDRARENYSLNNIRCDDRDFIKGDAGRALRSFVRKEKQFDLIIFDPPTFSRNKKSYFSVKKDYMKYCTIIEKLSPKYVLTAVNTYSVPLKAYLASHPSHWQQEFLMHEAGDFPFAGGPYLKCALWKIR